MVVVISPAAIQTRTSCTGRLPFLSNVPRFAPDSRRGEGQNPLAVFVVGLVQHVHEGLLFSALLPAWLLRSPTSPSRPEPRRNTVPGTGTADGAVNLAEAVMLMPWPGYVPSPIHWAVLLIELPSNCVPTSVH